MPRRQDRRRGVRVRRPPQGRAAGMQFMHPVELPACRASREDERGLLRDPRIMDHLGAHNRQGVDQRVPGRMDGVPPLPRRHDRALHRVGKNQAAGTGRGHHRLRHAQDHQRQQGVRVHRPQGKDRGRCPGGHQYQILVAHRGEGVHPRRERRLLRLCENAPDRLAEQIPLRKPHQGLLPGRTRGRGHRRGMHG